MQRDIASRITIHKVQPGETRVGCHPGGVQIFYKESTTIGGDPNLLYLRTLIENHGFEATEGDSVQDTPLKYLCVARLSGSVSKEEILALLAQDQEIDLSNVNRPEGYQGNGGGGTGG